MKSFVSVLCAILISSFLFGCVSVLSAPKTDPIPPSTSLGPDTPTSQISTESEANDSLSSRLFSGLSWLWASYAAMKAKGIDVSKLGQYLGDMKSYLDQGDWPHALKMFSQARSLITILMAL